MFRSNRQVELRVLTWAHPLSVLKLFLHAAHSDTFLESTESYTQFVFLLSNARTFGHGDRVLFYMTLFLN